jgi:3-methyladenine DNA glycosylase AlkD
MAPTPSSPLAQDIRRSFAAQADAARAAPMQAYMKSAMPFHGLPTPLRRRLTADAVHAHPAADTAALVRDMLALWQGATHREERYAAVELPRTGRKHPKLVDLSLLPLAQRLIADGAWWDLVDDLSGNLLPRLIEREPAAVHAALRHWAQGSDLWLRRAAMLAQRNVKPALFDAPLLYATILPSIGASPLAGEFFIRKGIGWALRERSYDAPDEVRAFCREYASQLAPLTVREALKALHRRGSRPTQE